MDVRRFTKSDWDCWSGCEVFDDQSEPMMVEIGEMLLIADGNGIAAFHDEREYFWVGPTGKWTPAMAELILKGLAGLGSEASAATLLKRYGFIAIL